MKSKQRDIAFSLYKEGHSQKEIAKLVGVNTATITKWKKENEWERKRTESNLAMTTAKGMVWDLINYNLRVLKIKKDAREKEYAQSSNPADLGLIEKGQIDAISKLFACVKGPEKKFSDYVEMMKDFIRFVEADKGVEKAQELISFSDSYLHHKRTELNE